jgi:hypothetical protein
VIPAPGGRRRTHAPRRAHRPGGADQRTDVLVRVPLVGRECAALGGEQLEVPLEQSAAHGSGARVTALVDLVHRAPRQLLDPAWPTCGAGGSGTHDLTDLTSAARLRSPGVGRGKWSQVSKMTRDQKLHR